MRPHKRTRDVDEATRKKLDWLFQRLNQVDPDQRPDVPALLDRIPRDRWPEVAEILLDALIFEGMPSSPVEMARRSVRENQSNIKELQAALRCLHQIKACVRDVTLMPPFIGAALEEVEADLKDELAGRKALGDVSGIVLFSSRVKRPVYVPTKRPRRGAPSKRTKSLMERLQASGASRDTARALLGAVRLAARERPPRPRETASRTYKRPPFLELAQAREDDKRMRAKDGFCGWAHRYKTPAKK